MQLKQVSGEEVINKARYRSQKQNTDLALGQ